MSAHGLLPVRGATVRLAQVLLVAALFGALAGRLPAQGQKASPRIPKGMAGPKAAGKAGLVVRSGQRLPGSGSLLPGSSLPAGTPGVLQAGVERERNETPALADPFGSNTDMDGTLSSNSDQDVFRLDLPADSQVTLSVTPRGASPAADPALLVTDAAGQFVAYADDTATSLYPNLTLPLPAGSYFLNVHRAAGALGGYRLSAAAAQTMFRPIPYGVPTNGTLAAGREDAYRLIVPSEGRVTITTTGGSLDLYLAILQPSGAVLRFVDDSSAGRDPGFDALLPAGIYFLVIGEYFGAAGPYSLTAAFAPGYIPAAPCGAARVTGVITGDESFALYRLQFATPQQVSFFTGPDGFNPLRDSVLSLLDADLRQICFNDDDGFSLYSRIQTVLPAGTYYVGVASFPYSTSSPEGYALTGTCAGPVTAPLADFGGNPGNIAVQGDAAAFRLVIGTPQPVEFLVDTSSGTLPDPMLAVLDGSGRLVAVNDDSTFGLDSFAGRDLRPGTHWVLVRDYDNVTGTFRLEVNPVLCFTDRVSNRTLNIIDKAGRQVFAFAALRPMPAPLPLTPPLGFLLIDLGLHVFLGVHTVPPSGVMTWPLNFQPYPVVIQGVSHEPATNLLWMTELVR